LPTVHCNDQCILVDGTPLQLISGAVHYFRIPRGQWRDRLEKCRNGGLNTIETIVPWNLHEPQPGQYNFTDSADLGFFLELCQEYGFYTIVRPSPYICGEWDNGGLPPWLLNRSGISFRRANPVFLAYVKNWYEHLLPIIAKRQHTRGGSVILVQIENEYGYFRDAQEAAYMDWLRDTLIELGTEVPLITCDSPGVGFLVPGAIKGANFGSGFTEGLQTLRHEQPDSLLFVSELWLAWFDHWHGQHNSRSGRDVANALREVLAAGGHYNFYMWCGGTNFGYFGGRTTTGEHGAFITTSYDYNAPIGETGVLTEKYAECRLVNCLAHSFSDFFATARAGSSTWAPSAESVTLSLRHNGQQEAYFLTNSSQEPACFYLQSESNTSPSQRWPEQDPLRLLGGDSMVLVWGIQLTERVCLQRVPFQILAKTSRDSSTCLILYGEEPLQSGTVTVAVDGVPSNYQVTIPQHDTALVLNIADASLVFITHQTAGHTFLVHDDSEELWRIDPHWGQNGTEPDTPDMTWSTADPITHLKRRAPSPSPRLLAQEWFGVWYGYLWYRTTFHATAEETPLILTAVHDRATVFVNGELQGTIGSFANFGHLLLRTRPGENELLILSDELGRYCFTSRLGERKGLTGQAYLGGEPVAQSHWQRISEGEFGWSTPWLPDRGVTVRITGKRSPVSFYVGDELVHHHRSIGDDDEFVELDITPWLRPSRPSLRMLVTNPDDPLPRLQACTYRLTGELTGPWDVFEGVVGETGEMTQSELVFSDLHWDTCGQDIGVATRPRLFRSVFDWERRDDARPLKLCMTGMHKGVVWLNGHHLGRYWSVGPQQALYVPEEYLRPRNTLIVFDELGCDPRGVHWMAQEHFL